MRDRGELVGVVSMDLSKAFDVIQHHIQHNDHLLRVLSLPSFSVPLSLQLT